MALSQSSPAGDAGLAWSEGRMKKQILKFSVASGDTSGTLTFDHLSRVDVVIVTGVTETAQPTLSGNTAVLAFADPLATVVGQAIAWGK